MVVTGRKTGWVNFRRDETGTASMEYVLLVAGIGLVLAGVLTHPSFGVSALYNMIFDRLTTGLG
jgi:Flp pilus assembly pilin Flp